LLEIEEILRIWRKMWQQGEATRTSSKGGKQQEQAYLVLKNKPMILYSIIQVLWSLGRLVINRFFMCPLSSISVKRSFSNPLFHFYV
jgi:hypothetical protein